MTTGERIEQLAKKKGMSLHKLATCAGVSYNTVYSAAKRKSNRIDMNILERIASVLEISVADLSGVDFEDHSDGSSVAVVDTSKVGIEIAQKLTFDDTLKGESLGFSLENASEKKALIYLLENGNTDPEWIKRLVDAFNKLNFPMQQILISNAEEMVRQMAYLSALEDVKQNRHEE